MLISAAILDRRCVIFGPSKLSFLGYCGDVLVGSSWILSDLRVGFLRHVRFVAQRQSTPAVARGDAARAASIPRAAGIQGSWSTSGPVASGWAHPQKLHSNCSGSRHGFNNVEPWSRHVNVLGV